MWIIIFEFKTWLSSPGKNKANPLQVFDSDLGAGFNLLLVNILKYILRIEYSHQNSSCILGGGFTYVFYVHPDPWGDDPDWPTLFKWVATSTFSYEPS